MQLTRLVDICDAYARLGGAVQEQLGNILDGEDFEDQNFNALKLIREFFAVAHNVGVEDPTELAKRLDAYLEEAYAAQA